MIERRDKATGDPGTATAATEADGDETPDGEGQAAPAQADIEIGGRDGPDPTRFGDWEKGGRCIDF